MTKPEPEPNGLPVYFVSCSCQTGQAGKHSLYIAEQEDADNDVAKCSPQIATGCHRLSAVNYRLI
jgi:hypothetical protein